MIFSDLIVYADESGDHGIRTINPENPVFVLAFCLFDKQDYMTSVVPAVMQFKFDTWGHDAVIFHSHEIRKQRGAFSILRDATRRQPFIERMNVLLGAAPFSVVAAAIDKTKLTARTSHPYDLALTSCMERLQRVLIAKGQADRRTVIVVERRGKAEDDELELTFRRVADGANAVGPMPNLDICFMPKSHNSTGLQIADLVAHPIARHVIKPDQPNKAFEVVAPKLVSPGSLTVLS
jgi:Protein of unknown function (DUF3800)